MKRRVGVRLGQTALAAAIVAGGALFSATTATAAGSSIQTVTGSFAELQPSFTARQAGGTTIVDFSAPVAFSGGIVGTATSTGTEIIAPTGDFTVQAVVTCSCSVAGRSGDLVLGFTGTGSFLTQQKQGQFVVSGSGGLADLHGDGSFTQSGLTGTYVADVHFNP
jgi:hypothetical protein